MATIQDKITDVKGIGPTTAVLLAEHGIKTVRDLASVSIAELVEIRGFTELRAGQVKFNAESLLKRSEAKTPPSAEPQPVRKKSATPSPAKPEKKAGKTTKDRKKTKEIVKEKSKDKGKTKKKDKKKDRTKTKSVKKDKKKK